MTEIQVTAAPAAKDRDAFEKEIRNSISKIANLCGWDREERELMMAAIEGNQEVQEQWFLLQKDAALHGSAPIWVWNKHVRNATDSLVSDFYWGR